jgi:hypothetical protein
MFQAARLKVEGAAGSLDFFYQTPGGISVNQTVEQRS